MAKDKIRIQTRLTVEKPKPKMEKAGKGGRTFAKVFILKGSLHLADVQKLLQDEHVYNTLEHTFDAAGGLHTTAFKSLQFRTAIKDCTITLGEGKLQAALKDCLIEKIKLVPKPGRLFDIKAAVHTNPTPKQNNTLDFELLDAEVKVIIEGGERSNENPDQAEMSLEPAAAAA